MRVFKYEPYKKVGLLEFGMSREQVRKIMGEYKEFRKSKFSKNSTDDFGDCHAFYTQNNTLQAVEVFNDAKLEMGNYNIFDFDYDKLESFFLGFDNNLELSNDSMISKALGLSVYAPNKKIESILVFQEGYYR